jgi:hypothetical protein
MARTLSKYKVKYLFAVRTYFGRSRNPVCVESVAVDLTNTKEYWFKLTLCSSASVDKVRLEEQMTWPRSIRPTRYRSTHALPCGHISSQLRQFGIILETTLTVQPSVSLQSASWYHSTESSDRKLRKEFRSRKHLQKRQNQFPYTTKKI